MWDNYYGSISSLKNRSGLGFNYSDGSIIVDDPKFWDDFVKIDPDSKGMNTKKWPFFEDWEEIFGKDRAPGEFAEGPQDAVEEIERSHVQSLSNMSLGFPINIIDDEDEADSTGKAESACGGTHQTENNNSGLCAFSATNQGASAETHQAGNNNSGPSAFADTNCGAYAGTQQAQNQGKSTQTSSSKVNETEKCRKKKKPIEDDEKFLNCLIETMKQFKKNLDKRSSVVVDKLGDRDHSEIRDKVLTVLDSSTFKIFTPQQKIKGAMLLTSDVKRMQVFLSRDELECQTMMWMIINGEI